MSEYKKKKKNEGRDEVPNLQVLGRSNHVTWRFPQSLEKAAHTHFHGFNIFQHWADGNTHSGI